MEILEIYCNFMNPTEKILIDWNIFIIAQYAGE